MLTTLHPHGMAHAHVPKARAHGSLGEDSIEHPGGQDVADADLPRASCPLVAALLRCAVNAHMLALARGHAGEAAIVR